MPAAAKHDETTTGPASETKLIATTAPESLPPTMSMQFWDLDWSKELPRTYASDSGEIAIHAARWAEGSAFVAANYKRMFGADAEGRFLLEEMTEAKLRFCQVMDVFLLKLKEETIGVALANPTDWSSYYVRMLAILPEHRAKRVGCDFTGMLAEVLPKYGVARWEADTSAANKGSVRLCTTSGMIVTSTSNSERWGMSLRFTKFLQKEAEEIFTRQFLRRTA
jgi:hypothetical protein